jgi:hypothetical protein
MVQHVIHIRAVVLRGSATTDGSGASRPTSALDFAFARAPALVAVASASRHRAHCSRPLLSLWQQSSERFGIRSTLMEMRDKDVAAMVVCDVVHRDWHGGLFS